MRQQSSPFRIPYHKMPDLALHLAAPSSPGRSLLKSMKDYQGFWKPIDLRKRQGQPIHSEAGNENSPD